MSLFYYQELKDYYRSVDSDLNPMERRLAREHLALEKMATGYDDISVETPEGSHLPPKRFEVVFSPLKSIVGVKKNMMPIFGDRHVLEITISPNYPVEAPVCRMLTSIWHPNIQSDEGPMKGRICGNTEGFGAFYSLDRLVLRIRRMLQWKMYLADFRFPYPEDETVARWVKRFAEPRGLVKKGEGFRIPTSSKQKIRSGRNKTKIVSG